MDKTPKNLRKELELDLLVAGHLTREQIVPVVDYLFSEGLVDYDVLKEYYDSPE